jgi:soluble cytochrome b562
MEGVTGTNYMVISGNNTNAAVEFDGGLSWDSEGDTLSYLWTEIAPPEGSRVPIPPGKSASLKAASKKASKKGGNPTTPAPGCDYGPVVELSLQYEGATSAAVIIVDKHGEELFSGDVAPGEVITFTGLESNGELGKEITVLIGTAVDGGFHTSGSKAIGPGLRSGSFLVVGGVSASGNPLCELAPAAVVDPIDFGSGVEAHRELHLGQHNIVLSVSDGDCDGSDTVLVEVVTAAQAVDLCIGLVEDSATDRKQKRSLVKALKKAAKEFDKGKFDKGVKELESFIKKVDKEAEKGKVSAADQAAFDACAQKVIDAVTP